MALLLLIRLLVIHGVRIVVDISTTAFKPLTTAAAAPAAESQFFDIAHSVLRNRPAAFV